MKKKQGIVIALVVIVIVVIAAIVAGVVISGNKASDEDGTDSADATETIELKMSMTPSESSVWMVAAEAFKEEVEEKTDGRYTITIYPSEQLAGGDLTTGVQMLLDGTTDIAMNSCINMTGFDTRFTVLSMPWLFPNGYDDVDEIMFNGGDGGEAIKELVTELGAHPLAIGDNGFRQLTNNVREVTSPEDLEGLKIRTPSITMYIELFQSFGADPVSMNWGEVFTALQQGTIDGQENPLDTIRSGKGNEVTEYLTMWNYSYDVFVLSLSDSLWESLSEEDREIFQTAADNACAKEIEEARTKDEEIRAEFEEEGIQITDLTDEQIEVFREASASIYESYREEIGEDLFARFGYTFED